MPWNLNHAANQTALYPVDGVNGMAGLAAALPVDLAEEHSDVVTALTQNLLTEDLSARVQISTLNSASLGTVLLTVDGVAGQNGATTLLLVEKVAEKRELESVTTLSPCTEAKIVLEKKARPILSNCHLAQ